MPSQRAIAQILNPDAGSERGAGQFRWARTVIMRADARAIIILRGGGGARAGAGKRVWVRAGAGAGECEWTPARRGLTRDVGKRLRGQPQNPRNRHQQA